VRCLRTQPLSTRSWATSPSSVRVFSQTDPRLRDRKRSDRDFDAAVDAQSKVVVSLIKLGQHTRADGCPTAMSRCCSPPLSSRPMPGSTWTPKAHRLQLRDRGYLRIHDIASICLIWTPGELYRGLGGQRSARGPTRGGAIVDAALALAFVARGAACSSSSLICTALGP